MMLSSDSDLTVLLKAMGEYQDQQRAKDKDKTYPTMVHHDWAFHEERTGFDRAKISRLLPQLVAGGLADDRAGHSKSGRTVSGMGAADGWAWISDRGQLVLSQLRQPPPPLQIELASLAPQAEAQLLGLLKQASELGVTKADLRRLEDLLEEIATGNETNRIEKAANLVELIQGSKELTVFFLVSVLPFLRSVVGS